MPKPHDSRNGRNLFAQIDKHIDEKIREINTVRTVATKSMLRGRIECVSSLQRVLLATENYGYKREQEAQVSKQ